MLCNTHWPAVDNECESNAAVLGIVVVYADIVSAMRAEKLIGSLQKTLGSEVLLRPSFWRFDEIALAELSEVVRGELDGADMLMVASRAGTELPVTVKTVFERTMARRSKDQPCAVVCLQADDLPKTTPLLSFERALAEISQRFGADFFSETPQNAALLAGCQEMAEPFSGRDMRICA